MGKKKISQPKLSESEDITDAVGAITSAPLDIDVSITQEDDHVSDVEISQEKIDSDMESIDVDGHDDFKDGYNDPDIPLPTPPVETDAVPGFNLIKASGLSDTSSPSVVKSDLPDHATASPIVNAKSLPSPPIEVFGNPQLPTTPITVRNDPTDPDSKSKVFTKRMDYMINEFFTSIFQQQIKEKLGSHWAHVTAQPEVNSAIKQVQDMYETFVKIQKVVEKQILAYENLIIVQSESSLFLQQLGFQESIGAIHEKLIGVGVQYHESTKHLQSFVLTLKTFLQFIINFREKAIQDSLETRDRQILSRQELDAFASRLGQLEERNLKRYAKSNHNSKNKNADFSTASEKELEKMRVIFQEAKEKYKILSTQMIDKAGILQMKLTVDFAQQLDLVSNSLLSLNIVDDIKNITSEKADA